MFRKLAVGLIVFAIAPQWLAFANQKTEQKRSVPDLTGRWVLQSKSGSHAANDITLVISQTDPEITITETFVRNGSTSEFTYYTDSRGETNLSIDGKQKFMSVTEWKDNTLISQFSLPPGRANNLVIVNERVDAWSLSSDGQTLTWTILVRSSSRPQDASVNPFGRPQGPNILATPLSWKQKRSFKRMP